MINNDIEVVARVSSAAHISLWQWSSPSSFLHLLNTPYSIVQCDWLKSVHKVKQLDIKRI